MSKRSSPTLNFIRMHTYHKVTLLAFVGIAVVSVSSFKILPALGAAGDVTTYAGSGQMGTEDGPAASASFAGPKGVTVDAYAGTGVAGDTNGPRLSASFQWMADLAIDKDGNLYLSEGIGSNVIRKIAVG
jgi:hypothetical protein